MRLIKYIRYPSGFVIFSEPMAHKEIHVREGENPISAGFCRYDKNKNKWLCYGSSVTLNLSFEDVDSDLLTKQMNGEW